MSDSEWGEWIEHDGGPCPITHVKVQDAQLKNREGWVMHGADINPYNWHWKGKPEFPWHIIAYRLRKSQ